MTMACADALQAHYDEIHANMPVLSLAAAPRGYSDLDLQTIEPATHNKLTQAIAAAASGLKQCQICSRSSSADALCFHISNKLNFESRTVTATACHFACSLCKAVSRPALLLELATPLMGSEDYSRSEALQQLFLHFAAVNSAPASITSNPEALAVWVQELACRAYSLQVAASSIRGWKLLGPSAQLVQQGTAGAGLKLLQQLLQSQQRKASTFATPRKGGVAKAAKSKSKQQQPGTAVALSEISKQQMKQMLAAEKAQPSSKRKKLSHDSAAAYPTSSKKAKKHPAVGAVDAGVAPAAAQVTPKQKHRAEQQQTQVMQSSRKEKGKAQAKAPSTDGVEGKQRREAGAFKTPQVAKAKKASKHRLSGPS